MAVTPYQPRTLRSYGYQPLSTTYSHHHPACMMANFKAPFGPPGDEDGIMTPVQCVDMHTSGEPTRIVYSGYPSVTGTLNEQRVLAKRKYDHIRRRLILEPRGHHDMYGAVLRPSTELVDAGEADMGILFMTNDGYSNMCGHATIALGRFLVDTKDPGIFPNGLNLATDSRGTHLRLHLPCGLVVVTVQTLPNGRSDPSRPVSFKSVPSFAAGIGLSVQVPSDRRWRVGKNVADVTVDIAFGGAFFALVQAPSLYDSKAKENLTGNDLQDLDEAAFTIIDLINENPELRKHITSTSKDIAAPLEKLYAVVIVFKDLGRKFIDTKGVETGVCYFDNHSIDRSPTGSAACARAALAYAKHEIALGECWTYQSLLSNSFGGKDGFIARVVEETESGVCIQLEGHSYYTGRYTSFVEASDSLGDDGFVLESLLGGRV